MAGTRENVRRFAQALRRFMRLCAFFSMLVLSGIMVLVVVDVVLRKLADAPILGVPELTEMSMLFVCFLSIGYIAARGQEIEIDMFNPRLSPRGRRAFDAVRILLSLFIVGIIVWQSVAQGLHVMRTGEVSMAMRMPLFPFYFVITFGATMYCIEMLLELYLGETYAERRNADDIDLLS